jgi:hypothetical protein
MPILPKQFVIGISLIGVFYAGARFAEPNPSRFHTPQELRTFQTMMADPVDPNIIFPTVSACVGCHGRDANGYASVDLAGNDVNVVDDWSATLMANSAKDPFWRAKVSHEVLLYPMHSAAIQDKCTSCHAPNGHYTAKFRSHSPYSMADLLSDTIGLQGVNCSTCHMISTRDFGLTFSGNINFDTNRVMYGPYYEPFEAPMVDFVGFRPLHGNHIPEAGTCAPCHSLVTHPVNVEGEPLGTSFVEQATYHEWLNSSYGLQNITCQDCHFPRIKDPVVISANYLFLEGRVPFGLHEMAGANTTMLKIMKNNRQALGITASEEALDETIAATFSMLQDKTLTLHLDAIEVRSDSATFALRIDNRAGHKFPSGYPSRRAFVSFVVLTEQGDTLFRSGMIRPDFEVDGHNSHFEPHYQLINRQDQVQIYEMVMGDYQGQATTVLSRGFAALKDNRIPPSGFSTSHAVYDTTRIYGQALQDPDFNRHNGQEGSGSDRVLYQVSVAGYRGNLRAHATVYYQSMPPKWMAEMFEESSPEIETFRTMFNEADRSPVAVSSAQISNVYVDGVTATRDAWLQRVVQVFPNPAPEGRFQVFAKGTTIQGIVVYDSNGRKITALRSNDQSMVLPGVGVFFVEIITAEGRVLKKIISKK